MNRPISPKKKLILGDLLSWRITYMQQKEFQQKVRKWRSFEVSKEIFWVPLSLKRGVLRGCGPPGIIAAEPQPRRVHPPNFVDLFRTILEACKKLGFNFRSIFLIFKGTWISRMHVFYYRFLNTTPFRNSWRNRVCFETQNIRKIPLRITIRAYKCKLGGWKRSTFQPFNHP